MNSDEMKTARRRFTFANDADTPQREREKKDLGFYEGETQWPEGIKSQRAGQDSNGANPAVPAKPCLVINQVRDPVRRIQNDMLQTELGMSIVPADDFGGNVEHSEIELREGLARRIQRQSDAMDARMWAAGRSTIAGRGRYGISTKWCDGDTFDQELVYERFYDQFSVLGDPAAEQPDGSDSEFEFVGRDMPWDIYKSKYPRLAKGANNPLAEGSLTDSEWRAFGNEAPGWVNGDTLENRSVRVTTYWRYERAYRDLVLLDDWSTVRAELVPKDILDKIPSERRREREVKIVKRAVIDGVHTLEEDDWAGQYIPIIHVVGEEIHPFDEQRRAEGMVRNARDPQQAFNVMLSEIVNMIAMGPKSRIIAAAGQLEGFETMWKESAIRNWPYLLYNLVTDATGGQVLPPPQIITAEPPIQAMAQMLVAFQQGIQSAIGQAALGDIHPEVRSGKMAKYLVDDSLRGTNNYMANLVRSVHYEGKVVNDLLYPIYGRRPGRILSLLTGSNKSQRVMVGTPQAPRPFVVPDNTAGRPVPHDPVAHADMTPQQYALTPDGIYNIAIAATPQRETRRQQGAEALGDILAARPEMISVFGDIWADLLDVPEHDELAKRLRAVLAPPIQQQLRDGQPVDPRLQQAMQMGQQLAQENIQLKSDKGARIEQAQIKALADTTTSDHDNETKMQIAKLEAETKIMVADIAAGQKANADAMNAFAEQMRTVVELLEERRLSREQRDHERDTQHHSQAHELGLAMVEHQHAKDALEHEARVMPQVTNGNGNATD